MSIRDIATVPLTVEQFASEILANPNKAFCFMLDARDDYCYHLASVNIFGVQTLVINAAKIIGNVAIPCPGASYAAGIACYDIDVGCYDREDCTEDITAALNAFRSLQGADSGTWYLINDDFGKLEVNHIQSER